MPDRPSENIIDSVPAAVSKIRTVSNRQKSIRRNQHRAAQTSCGRLCSWQLHALTIMLAVLAATILALTEADGGSTFTWLTIQLTLTAILTGLLAFSVRRRAAVVHASPIAMPFLLLIVLLSIGWEPLQRVLFSSGRPFEMLVMFSQKNLMLGLAAFGCWQGFQRLSLLIGVSISIFCAVICQDRAVHVLIAIYGVLAIAWLVANYWDMLRARLLKSDHSGIPRGWLVAAAALPLLLLVASASAGNRMISAMEGFLPGSGGTGKFDPFSRGGVNDGEGLVAGSQNIKSFAPIEDAPFAEDDKPSLYDVFSDTFEEPVRKNKRQERSVALPPELLAEVRQRMAKSEQAGREFSTLRTTKKPDRQRIRNLNSSALFYVAGRVPLHLRFELYDIFDGLSWTPEEVDAEMAGLGMSSLNGRPWLSIPPGSRGLDLYTGTETHAVKIVNLKSNVIPSPPDTRGIHIDKVEQPDMFALHQDGVVRMTRDSLPELQAIHLLSERVAYDELPEHRRIMVAKLQDLQHLQLPSTLHMQAVSELAKSWTSGIPRGWKQVEAITGELRKNYQLDRESRPAADCEFPVGDFLLRSRRGPEYLFASSAALMLRSLGYPTRLVSGFYAAPDKYDVTKRHTGVSAEDAHVWCEVLVGARTWLTVEASPGYEILQPPPSFRQKLQQLLAEILVWIRHRWWIVATLIVGFAVAYRKRKLIIDGAITAWWTLSPMRSPRGRVLQTAWLLDRRLRAAGLQRPPGVTLNRWLKKHTGLQQISRSLPEFLELVDWAAFAERDEDRRIELRTAEACCRRLHQEITLRNIFAATSSWTAPCCSLSPKSSAEVRGVSHC